MKYLFFSLLLVVTASADADIELDQGSVVRDLIAKYGNPRSIDENETGRITVLNYETWGIRIVNGVADKPTALVDWVEDDYNYSESPTKKGDDQGEDTESTISETETEEKTPLQRHSSLRPGEQFFDTEGMLDMLQKVK